MATYLWSALADGTVINSFNPNIDVLRFDDASISAANMGFFGAASTAFTFRGKTVTLGTTIQTLTTTNVTFDNGSMLMIGDNTTSTVADDAANTLTGGAGNDSLHGLGGNDQLSGLGGADSMNGGQGNDNLNGGDGDDSLVGDAGADVLDGGANGPFGDWVYYGGSPGGVTVNLAGGTASDGFGSSDTLLNIENVQGTPYNDILTGDANRNLFRPEAGNDVVQGGGAEVDTVFYESSTSGVTINLLAGIASGVDIGFDALNSIEAAHGSYVNDTIIMENSGTGYVFGRAGNDFIMGGSRSDSINPGSGADIVDGGDESNDTVGDTVGYMDDGFDGIGLATHGVIVNLATGIAIDNWGFTDKLIRIEQVRGSSYADVITGDDAANFLRGNLGDDTLDGGGQGLAEAGGNSRGDYADYFDAPGSVFVNLATGTASGADGNDTLVNFESVRGSAYADMLTGDEGANYLRGGSGNDSLDGAGGLDFADYRSASAPVTVDLAAGTSSGADGADTLVNIEGISGSDFDDTLLGNTGDNWFRGRLGNDAMNGGAGFDTVTYRNTGNGVTVNLNTGLASGEGSDTLTSIEAVEGSFFSNDTLTGSNAAADSLFGFGGNDLLRQTLGADLLDGGTGFDNIEFTQTGVAYGGVVAVSVDLAAGKSDADTSSVGAVSTLVSIENVRGTVGNDVFTGGDAGHATDAMGNRIGERFFPGAGNDTVNGAAGNHFFTIVDYSANTAAQPVQVTLGNSNNIGTASDGQGGTDALFNVDSAVGGAGNDVLTGGSYARSANGILSETFRGNAGDDIINGRGSDTTTGELGVTDTADYGNSPNAVVVNLGTAAISGNFYGTPITVAAGTARDGFTAAGGGTDTLTGIDTVIGSAFNDRLVGSNPAGDSGEFFEGGAGADFIDGGLGNDEARYLGSPLGVTVNLAAGIAADGFGSIDTLVNVEWARGSDFNDTLIGGSFAVERLTGEAGNDTIDGGGTVGVSYAAWQSSAAAVSASVSGGSGTASDGLGGIDMLVRINGLWGSNFNDVLAGGAGNQWFRGRGGNDAINGGADTDTVSYSGDPLAVTVDLTAGTGHDGWGGIWGMAGVDTLTAIENVEGTSFSDVIKGSAAANVLDGSDSADSLYGMAGADTLKGGNGNDNLYGGVGGDVNDGGAGFDYVRYDSATVAVTADLSGAVAGAGDAAGDSFVQIEGIVGSPFGDQFYGDANANTLQGRDGNDTLQGRAGADRLEGGNGLDFASYVTATAGVVANLGGTGSGGDAAGDTYFTIEGLTGSNFTDTLTGDGNANEVQGLDGNDSLYGLAGNDTLRGGNGADSLYGGAGADVNDGGADFDYARYDTAVAGVIADLSGAVAGGGDGAGDTFLQIEGLVGSAFADQLYGNAGANTLQGRNGDDALNGRAGADVLTGGTGNDSFTFKVGEAQGDTVTDFDGTVAADHLFFQGYGVGATFVQTSATKWNINHGGGVETITFSNSPVIDASDYTFV